MILLSGLLQESDVQGKFNLKINWPVKTNVVMGI